VRRTQEIKLTPPQPPAFALARAHLLRRLDASRAHVTLLVAPPGFGKTVLMAQWARAQPEGSVAWVTLDDADNDPRLLVTNLVAAVARVSPGFAPETQARLTQRGAGLGPQLLAYLLDELAALPSCVVVLDDVDTISSPVLRADLTVLVEQSRENVRFVVGTRTDTHLALHRLQLRGEVLELRQRDLSVDRNETRQILERLLHRRFSPEQVDALASRTEGWPAAVHLAVTALHDATDIDAAIARFTGNDEHVASYLTDEVLAHQPKDVEEFLLRTSVLERLSGPLCDAVTGNHDGYEMLTHLGRESLFVIRLDEYGEWYRYRRLFRDLLRHRLRAAGEDESELLRRAAEWHFAHDDVDAGAMCLVTAENWDGLIRLVERQGRALFERGSAGTALRWLDTVPEAVKANDRSLLFDHAALASMTGNTLLAEEDLRRAAEAQPFSPSEQAAADTLRATWVEAHAAPDTVVAATENVLHVLDKSVDLADAPVLYHLGRPESLRAMAVVSRARAFHYRGDVATARTILRDFVLEPDVYAPWMIAGLGTLSLIEAWTGHLRRAEQHATRALKIAADRGLEHHPSTSNAYTATACHLREQGRLAEAEQILADAAAVEQRTERAVPLAVIAAELALSHLARGAPLTGLEHVAQFRQQGHAPPPARIASRLNAVEARLLVAVGEPDRAAAVLEETRLGTTEVFAAQIELAVAQGEIDVALKLIDCLRDTSPDFDLRARLEAALWFAIVQDLDDDARGARRTFAEVIAAAEPEGHVRLFLDVGAPARRLLRGYFAGNPSPYAGELLQRLPKDTDRTPPRDLRLADPLSERELLVLSYLQTRLSNAEIAEQLFISLNTLKTHLRHVYQKLDVTGRREAVEVAEALDLL
jgi:LuxR family maltose regulon positive regulatory protein